MGQNPLLHIKGDMNKRGQPSIILTRFFKIVYKTQRGSATYLGRSGQHCEHLGLPLLDSFNQNQREHTHLYKHYDTSEASQAPAPSYNGFFISRKPLERIAGVSVHLSFAIELVGENANLPPFKNHVKFVQTLLICCPSPQLLISAKQR